MILHTFKELTPKKDFYIQFHNKDNSTVYYKILYMDYLKYRSLYGDYEKSSMWTYNTPGENEKCIH